MDLDNSAGHQKYDAASEADRIISRASQKSTAKVTRLDYWLAQKMLDVVGNPPIRMILWDGQEVSPPCENPIAIVTFNDRTSLYKTLTDPELHWGEMYCSGRIDLEGNMTEFMSAIYSALKGKPGWLRRVVLWLGHRRIHNTMDKAKENIHHHYDIGNEFYELWLDNEEMQYTCAYFPGKDMTLEEGQIAKLHHVCRKLELKPGDTVVEAGCGWGGLARFMARNYGVSVTAYNISEEQVKYARHCAEEQELGHQVNYVLDDYRNISGKYDVFVSVGMLEHVAINDYRELGVVIKDCLKPEGRGLIHSIGRIQPGPMNAWIERKIFPGARPPALSEMMQIFEPNRLSVRDVENLRLHYSRTLAMWAERFNKQKVAVAEMMDEEFVRAWGLYLSGSESAFDVGNLQLYQVVFSNAENNDIPWSRHHLYLQNDPENRDDAKMTSVP